MDSNSNLTELGWPAFCLPVKDLAASIAFYEKLDFTAISGTAEEGYAVMQQQNHELHLHTCLDTFMFNLRGGDVEALVAKIKERGLSPQSGHVDSDGQAIEAMGCMSACYFDPDGREVMLDTHPDETRMMAAGEPFCTQGALSKIKADPMLLGNMTWCMDCQDLNATIEFYEKLGLYLSGDFRQQKWAIMTFEEQPAWGNLPHRGVHISLFEKMLGTDMLHWRGGNVFAIADVLKERGVEPEKPPYTDETGSDNLFVKDPDGHTLYFNTYPQERLY